MSLNDEAIVESFRSRLEAKAHFSVHIGPGGLSQVAFSFEKDPAGRHYWLSVDIEAPAQEPPMGADMAEGLAEARRLVEKYREVSGDA